jgi:hypothetical protein
VRLVLGPLFWLLRWACVLAVLCFAVAALRAALAPLRAAGGWNALLASAASWLVLGGLAARWLLTRWRRGDPLELVDTLEHELTHAAVGTLTCAPPVSLTATLRDGGEVQLRRSNPLAALAPYVLPLYAYALALLALGLRDDWARWGRLAVAFALGSFAWRFLREFHFGQTDFLEYGRLFSVVFIAAGLPLCLLGLLDLARLVDVPWREAAGLGLEQARGLWEAALGLTRT